MVLIFFFTSSSLYSNYYLSIEPWKEPINLFVWFIYALVIFSGITYSSIYLLKRNHRHEIKKKQEIEQIKTRHLKDLIQKHIQTQEYERMRIGSDLHDTLSNKLSLILLKLHMQYDREQLELDIKEALLTVRDISHDLNPPFYKNTALHVLILNQFQKVISTYTFKKCLRLYDTVNWSANYKMQIIRIVQELITNIIKHAKATEISLDIRETKKGLYLLIEDNGIGGIMDSQGLGHENIKNRLFIINGRFKIKSKIDCGTKIIICIQNEI